MNDSIVKTLPNDLSENAFNLYRKSSSGSTPRRSDMSEEDLVAAAEIVEAGLGWLSEYSFGVERLSKVFTVVEGRSTYTKSSRIDVYRQDGHLGMFKNLLLATVLDGDFRLEDSNTGWKRARIESRHETATDVEHDSSYVFQMNMVNPQIVSMYEHRTEFVATAVDGYWYDFGVDPLTQGDDQRYDYPSRGLCDYEHCEKPHPFAPYLPPQRIKSPILVRFEVTPNL